MITAIDKEAWGYATVLGARVRRPQRRVPAAALHPDEVPPAGAAPPRRVRHLPGALHGVLVAHQLRHRPRDQPIAGDRPDPEPVGRRRRGSHTLRRHPAEGTRRHVRRLRPVRPRVRPAVPRHRHRADRARRIDRPTADAHHDRAHVRGVGGRLHRRAPRPGALAARLPGPGDVPDAGRDRGRGDHDLRRAGEREHHHSHLRPREQHDHRRRHRRRVPRVHRLLRGRRRDAAEPRLPHQRRVRQLPRSVHRLLDS